ncbi:MAG: hypothetical protein KOO60_07660 [Gemmatimonadales bacterium]|nr:hypothetical protein [Gemmatimonadales bacterium]
MKKELRIVTVLLIGFCGMNFSSVSADPAVKNVGVAGQSHRSEEVKITLITSGWVELQTVLENVAGDVEMGLQVAPDVTGKANVHLVNVPLSRALESILSPDGLGFEILDNVITVYKNEMVTKWFSFDYPVTEREGRGKLSVSGRGQSQSQNQSGEGGDTGSDENESHVTSSAAMAVWPHVGRALASIIFQGAPLGSGSAGESEPGGLALADVSGRSLVVSPMAGMVQVCAEWDRVAKAKKMIKILEEALKRQVAIEVKVLEVSFSEQKQMGINWSTIQHPGGALVDISQQSFSSAAKPPYISFLVGKNSTEALIEAIAVQGNVKVISSPRITTLNNQKAVVRVVTEEVFYVAETQPAVITDGVGTEPITSYYPTVIPVGIVLDVTPQIGQDRQITLNVHPTLSNIVGVATSPNQDTQPIVSVRELDTVGMVPDGQTLVIAGLISEGTVNSVSGVPILHRIPLLGNLFKSSSQQKTTTELVMLLTPVILDGDRAWKSAQEAEDRISSQM